MNKERIRQGFVKTVQFILNPRLLLCVGVAWVLTNGWSYVIFAAGTYFDIPWMVAVGGAYLTFLWLPISPEKLVTFAIAIGLLRWWFPNDRRTLAVLKTAYANAKAAVHRRKERRQQKKNDKDASAS